MVFSSSVFLFFALPMIILIYYFFVFWKNNILYKNIILLLASLVFYTWGEPRFVILLLISIGINWFIGLKMDTNRKKIYFWIGISFNIGLLFVFKYLTFIYNNFMMVLGKKSAIINIELPIGISFFTFQALSYIIDVYKGNEKVQKSLFKLAMYISFFPQLVAGPIIRYGTIVKELDNREENIKNFGNGVMIFIRGLAKKVIISNNLAYFADASFMLSNSELSVIMAWGGV